MGEKKTFLGCILEDSFFRSFILAATLNTYFKQELIDCVK
jgi:hypothetical protein